MHVRFELNGKTREFATSPGEKLRDLLEREGIVSVRNGCDGQGSCGLCSVLLDGRLVNSCLLLTGQVDGKKVHTIEFLNEERTLSAIQSAFIDAGVVQCGYCTPAMILAVSELLAQKERPSREQVRDALSGIFCRCTGYEQLFEAVELARWRLVQPEYRGGLAPEFRPDLRVVGKPGGKIDGPALARGERAFVEDRVQPGSCHLKMLRSPHAHAYIRRIDTRAAEALPGVILVLTHENCPDVAYNQAGQGYPEPSPYDRRMFGHKVRHVGDRVAAVVAETPQIAARARDLIEVEYEVLPPVLGIEQAAAPAAPLVHNGRIEFMSGTLELGDETETDPREGKILYPFSIGADPRRNIAASVKGGVGDVEQGFAAADVVLEREYETALVQCTPAEPHVVYTRLESGRLVIHASTQVPWHLRRIVARILDISENRIRVVKERVGGGFGSKQDIVLEDVAAYATWRTGRAVFFRFDREEEFVASRTRHPMKIRVKLGAKRDGRLTAMEMNVRADTGPYGVHCLTVPMNSCSKSLPLFACDNVRFSVTSYYTNSPIAGAYQGYGAPQGSFAMQLAFAELAAELGLDHLELLEMNRVREGSVLEILKSLGEGQEGIAQRVASCGLSEALRQGAERIAWGRGEESDDPDVSLGKGVAIVQQGSGLPGLDSANAVLTMLSDGTFMLLSGGTDLGTGLDTVTTKVVAECLCTRLADVSLIAADTDVTPFDTGAYASSGTFFSGGAALDAARAMKLRILEIGGELLGESPEELELLFPATVQGKGGEVTYRDIALHVETGTGTGQITTTGRCITDKAAFPYGAHFCQVAVHRKTGVVRVRKYYALQDCGTPINPELALGQIYGGVLKTIGHALFEEMILDERGRCLNANLLDYKVPMIGDLPEEFRAELVETDDPYGPYGGKSVSEISCNGAAPAIAAAIHDAVGIWLRRWPFTPERVLEALERKGTP